MQTNFFLKFCKALFVPTVKHAWNALPLGTFLN